MNRIKEELVVRNENKKEKPVPQLKTKNNLYKLTLHIPFISANVEVTLDLDKTSCMFRSWQILFFFSLNITDTNIAHISKSCVSGDSGEFPLFAIS